MAYMFIQMTEKCTCPYTYRQKFLKTNLLIFFKEKSIVLDSMKIRDYYHICKSRFIPVDNFETNILNSH